MVISSPPRSSQIVSSSLARCERTVDCVDWVLSFVSLETFSSTDELPNDLRIEY